MLRLTRVLSKSLRISPKGTPLRYFSSGEPRQYSLTRPWNYEMDDYILLFERVTFSNTTDKIIDTVNTHYFNLNEHHLNTMLENMFNNYIEFTKGQSLSFELCRFDNIHFVV